MIHLVVIGCLWFGTGCDTPPEPVIDYRELVWCLVYPQHCVDEDPPDATVNTSPPTNTGMGNQTSDVEQWRPLIASVFPAGQVDYALCVIKYESGGNPDAYNPSTASGLFQVKSSIWGGFGNLFDPATNVAAAYYIWSQYGWGLPGGWTPKPDC